MQILHIRTGRPYAQLEYIIFAFIGLSRKGIVPVIGNPLIRDIGRHANRIFPVLGKQNIILGRMFFQQAGSLVGRRDHLHRIKTIQLVDRLELHDPGSRKRRSFLARQFIFLYPVGRSGILERRIIDSRIITATAHHIFQVINVILSRNSLRLENHFPSLPVHSETAYIGNPFSGRRIHYDQILIFRIQVTAAPFDSSQYRIRRFLYRDNYPVITQRVGIPVSQSVQFVGRHGLSV